jgi:ketosteroid isomerase-like protein
MPAAEVVEAFGAAWAAHDLETALSFLSEECVFDATGPAPDGTRHVGREAIRAAWQEIFDNRSSLFEPEETFSAGDRVVQRWRYTWDGDTCVGSTCSRWKRMPSSRSCRM